MPADAEEEIARNSTALQWGDNLIWLSLCISQWQPVT